VGGDPTAGILDALSFIMLTVLQWGLVLYVTVRDRRARARQASPEASLSKGALT
jgi:hypothetical protein